MVTHTEVLKIIDEIESSDETSEMLEKAMNSYCGIYDICEGYKQALRYTINDQYHNHPEDQNEAVDMEKLKSILEE